MARYRKRVKIGVAICLLSSAAIVVASFMPWLEVEGEHLLDVGGVPVQRASGWELVELRSPVDDVYAVEVSFPGTADRSPESVVTGFAALLSAMCLAGTTVIPLSRIRPKTYFIQQAQRRKRLLRVFWLLYLIPLGLLGLLPALDLASFIQRNADLGVSAGFGLVLLWVASLAGTVGVVVAGSGIGEAQSVLPDVRRAEWMHPYRLSGACSARTGASMLATGVAVGIVLGFVGFWVGWLVARLFPWLMHTATVVVDWAQGEGLFGAGVAVALVAIVVLASAFAALGFPVILGMGTGSGVAAVARDKKCRNPGLATAFGLLSGLVTVGALWLTGLVSGGAVHESSRILTLPVFDTTRDALATVVLAIDAALVVLSAALAVHGEMKDSAFCEACQKWYAVNRETTIPIGTAEPLVSALASGSAAGLAQVRTLDRAEIALKLQRCECASAEAVLTAEVKWTKVTHRSGKTFAKNKQKRWFRTTLRSELGTAIERAVFSDESATPAVLASGSALAAEEPGPEVPGLPILELKKVAPQNGQAGREERPVDVVSCAGCEQTFSWDESY